LPGPASKYTIWEAAWGRGVLASHLGRVGYTITFADDFLKQEPDHKWDFIVTNPPYRTSLRYSFLVRAYSLGKPFAFLLPYTTMEGHKRQRLFDAYGIDVIYFDERINFTGGSGAWFGVCWMTWGFHLPKPMMFMEMAWLRKKYAKLLAK